MKRLMLKIYMTSLSVTLISVTANSEANAQVLLNGKPATASELAYLQGRGLGQGRWQIDGWGLSAAQDLGMRIEASARHCRYVLDVPLDCEVGVASR
jgi:hypothetical protein